MIHSPVAPRAPTAPVVPVPTNLVVNPPPSSIYRVIRAHTKAAIEGAGSEATPGRKRRPKWWKGRKRPTVMVTLTEALHHTLVTVAAQESIALAAAARTLMALGAARYDQIITERVARLSKEAVEEARSPSPPPQRGVRGWAGAVDPRNYAEHQNG